MAENQLSRILETTRRYRLQDLLSGLHLASAIGDDAASSYVQTAVERQPRSAAAWLTYGLLEHQRGNDATSYKESLDAALAVENAKYFDAGFASCNAGAARALYGAWSKGYS